MYTKTTAITLPLRNERVGSEESSPSEHVSPRERPVLNRPGPEDVFARTNKPYPGLPATRPTADDSQTYSVRGRGDGCAGQRTLDSRTGG